MDTQHAHDVLGTKPGDGAEVIRRVYQKRKSDLERQIAEAPTPALGQRRRKSLEEVEEAFQVAASSAGPVTSPGAAEKTAGGGGASSPIGVGEYMLGDPPRDTGVREGSTPTEAKSSEGRKIDLKKAKASLKKLPPWAPAGIVVAGVTILLLVVISLMRHRPDAGNAGHEGEGGVAQAHEKTKTVPELMKEATDRMLAGEDAAAIAAYRKILEIEPSNTLALEQLTKLAPTRGRIHVVTKPAGALVEVTLADKKPAGIGEKATVAGAGVLFDDLPFAPYAVHIHLTGYEPVNPVGVAVAGTRPQEVQVELKRQMGALALTSEPSGLGFNLKLVKNSAGEPSAETFEKEGKTNQEMPLPTGKYELVFANGQKREVDITPGAKAQVAILGSASPTVGEGHTGSTATPSSGGANASYTVGDPVPKDAAPLQVTTDKRSYHNGEAVVCTVQIPYDGYLMLYSIDARKNRTVIFPNGYEKNCQVKAGQTVHVPGNNTYDLKLELPPGLTSGEEAVHAVLSKEPFTAEAAVDFSAGPFQELGPGSTTELHTRGLKPTQKASIGEIVYEVTP